MGEGKISDRNIKSSAQDLVTEVDKGSEMMIRRLLMTYFLTHAFLGEESVQPGLDAPNKSWQDSEFLWIVDPIDGTKNFVHGFPFYSVSIALAHKGEINVGVVYDPSSDEMFVAEKGKGAYLRGKCLYVSDERQLKDSLLASGFPLHEQMFSKNSQAMHQ